MRGERLDPPLLLMLDECTRICPIPVPALLADSGGRGIMMILAAQGLAQIEERWGKPAARSVLDTSNQLYVSGHPGPGHAQDGVRPVRRWPPTRSAAARARPPITRWRRPAMISRLPARRALVLRGGMPAPVITHLPMAWNDWRYRWARLRGRTVADLAPVPAARPACRRSLAPGPAAEPRRPTARPGRRDGGHVGAAGRQRARQRPPATATRNGRPGRAAYPWDMP